MRSPCFGQACQKPNFVCFTKLMAPALLKQAWPETALPTRTFPLVSVVTVPLKSYSVEPLLHEPCPGEVGLPENVVVPLPFPFQVIVPPVAKEVATALPLPRPPVQPLNVIVPVSLPEALVHV